MENQNTNLEALTTQELKRLLIIKFDGNAGEILNAFKECRMNDAQIRKAIMRFLQS